MDQPIRITRTKGVATLWLNHPPLNILTIPILDELRTALDEIESDMGTRVLVIRGEGSCFSAGMDVRDHLPDRMKDMLEKAHQVMRTIAEMNVPVISLIHGYALGGGLELASVCDFVYAVEGCKIGLPEITLGVFPPFAAAYFPELIGPRNASDLILSGRTILPEEAKKLGLIQEVFSERDFETRLNEIANRFLVLSPSSLALTKKALLRSSIWERLRSIEDIYLNELMATEDALTGLKAFLEKRK